jgi:hypothetical protein
MLNSADRICATRAMKNVRYLQRLAPHIMPAVEPPEGFGSIIPLPILAGLHRPEAHARLTLEERLAASLSGVTFPEIRSAVLEPLFNGTLFFVRIHFTVQSEKNAVISVGAADVNTAMQYARLAVTPISQYASQYGPNSVTVSPHILSFSVTLPDNTYNDTKLQGIVNSIATTLPGNACLVVLNPPGLVNTFAPLSKGFGGYHSKANIPYIFVNVSSQSQTIADLPFNYAGILSHEIAEMVVDPQADNLNPEVCDLCGPNCAATFLDYFDSTGTYIFTSQTPPYNLPPTSKYSFYLNGIVLPAFTSTPCNNPRPASSCSYAPVPLVGQDHFYTMDLSERDNAIDNIGYLSEGLACYVYPFQQGAPGTVKPLLRLHNAVSGDHFYTTDPGEANAAIGYLLESKAACFVFPAAAGGTVPLHRLHRPTGDHFYLTSDTERDAAIANYGYQGENDACFVYPGSSSGTTPFYRLFRPTGDHFYTTSLTERDNAMAVGYQSENLACYVYPPGGGQVGTEKLFRWYSQASGDHLYTTNQSEQPQGYTSEGVACFVYPPQGGPAGTQPLYRFFNPATSDHFYTLNQAEGKNLTAEGTACSVYPGEPSGTTPLYRLFHPFS